MHFWRLLWEKLKILLMAYFPTQYEHIYQAIRFCQFPPMPWPWRKFRPILLVYNSLTMIVTKYGIDWVKKNKNICDIKVFQFMQITKISIMANSYDPTGFYVNHIELDLCGKFQVNQINSVRCVDCQKLHFQSLITAPPCGRLGSSFYCEPLEHHFKNPNWFDLPKMGSCICYKLLKGSKLTEQ